MADRNRYRYTRWLRWTSRIICIIFMVFGATILIGGAVSEYLTEDTVTMSVEGSTLIIIGVFALVGCIVSWWRDLIAGILLVAISAGLGIHIAIYAGHNHFLAWLVLGLPYFIAGILLLSAWRLSKSQAQLPE